MILNLLKNLMIALMLGSTAQNPEPVGCSASTVPMTAPGMVGCAGSGGVRSV